jgi:hypothetical protein
MQFSFGTLFTVALVGVFGLLGLALTFRPRLIRGMLVRMFHRQWVADEFIMPGALISMRVIGLACLALALVVIIDGQRIVGSI